MVRYPDGSIFGTLDFPLADSLYRRKYTTAHAHSHYYLCVWVIYAIDTMTKTMTRRGNYSRFDSETNVRSESACGPSGRYRVLDMTIGALHRLPHPPKAMDHLQSFDQDYPVRTSGPHLYCLDTLLAPLLLNGIQSLR